jgi:sec-independent protein translocase protein TatC
MSSASQNKDPDDLFTDTRMSFGDHLEELRAHLWRAIYGFGVALVFSFFIGDAVMQYIAKPVEKALNAFYDKRVKDVLEDLKKKEGDPNQPDANRATPFVQVAFDRDQLIRAVNPNVPAEDVSKMSRPVREEDQGKAQEEEPGKIFGIKIEMPNFGGGGEVEAKEKPRVLKPGDQVVLWVSHTEPLREAAYLAAAQRFVGQRPQLSTLNVQEAMVIYFYVCIGVALVLGSPWIFYQIWAFVAAGLYPHEKKLVHYYLPLSLGLFLAGVVICELFVMPAAVNALLFFNEWLGLEPNLRLEEWMGFATMMPIIFGASFQTPLVMFFLERVGIVNIDLFRKYRKIAWFTLAVFAAVITPSVDAVSMLLMWVPLCLLFELGIWLCKFSPRGHGLDVEVPESEEMVEV